MRKYRLAIWDWNGTLQNDATHVYKKGARQIFKHFGLPCPSFATYRREIAHNYMEFYQRYGVPLHITNEELNKVFRRGLKKKGSIPPPIFSDTRKTLQDMSKQVETQHIVSGCPQSTLEEEITHHNITHFFTHIVGDVCDKVEAFRRLMEEHRTQGEDTLIIGDFSHDAIAAKAVGAQAIICTRGFHSRSYLESLGSTLEGVLLVDSLEEIPNLLSPLTPSLPSR